MHRSRWTPKARHGVVIAALMSILAALGASAPAAWASPAVGTPVLTVAPAGTYHYRQVSPAANPAPVATLVVASAGTGTQIWTKNFGSKAAVSTSIMSYASSGIATLAQSEQLSGSNIGCTFAAPLLWLPSPPTAGVSFSGHAPCTGGAVLTVTGKVVGNVMLAFNGQSVSTVLVGSTSVMAVTVLGLRYEVDVTEVDWYLPTLPIPLQSAIHVVIPSQGSTTDSSYVLQTFTQP